MSVSIIFLFHFLHPINILNELHGSFSVCCWIARWMKVTKLYFCSDVFRYSDVIVASIPNLIAKHVQCVITWLSISLFQWTRFFVLEKENEIQNRMWSLMWSTAYVRYSKVNRGFFFLFSFFLSSKRKQQYAFLLQLEFVSLAINRCAHR